MLRLCMTKLKILFLFLVGGLLYVGIEILYRGYSHISMFIAGGTCFLLIGLLNEHYRLKLPLVTQMLISSLFITAVELIIGLIVNKWLNLGVWDYSELPLNVMGQICLPFTSIWFFLTFPAIMVHDLLRFLILKESRSKYYFFKIKRAEEAVETILTADSTLPADNPFIAEHPLSVDNQIPIDHL